MAAATAPPSDSASPDASGQPATSPQSAAPVDPASIGYTVINLREADYLKVKAQLDGVAGMSFPSEVRNLPPTRDFARAVLAQVTPVATEKMAGTDGWKVIIVDTTGGTLETLADHPAVAGQRVTLTLDTHTQQVAEAALGAVTQPAVLVVMQPSTGEILAVAQNAAANAQGAPALTGQYPPGSTFKVVTATAGLERGLIAPGQPVDCPGVFEIEGRAIRNSHDFALGTVDSTLAFAKSCNTTFANLATTMPADALPAAATDYGIGLDFVMEGATTLTGSVPDAPSQVQRAENGFGQGQVLITPFSAALMAATAQHGTMPMPVLIRGTTTTVDKPAPARSPQVQQGIQTYMKAVVDEGTGQGLEEFGDVHAKTGTAEFTGDDGAIHAHAWTVGYVGDLAFAALIVGGEDSIVHQPGGRAVPRRPLTRTRPGPAPPQCRRDSSGRSMLAVRHRRRRLAGMLRTVLKPGTPDADPCRPRLDSPTRVRRPGQAREEHRPLGAAGGDHREDAGRQPDRGQGDGGRRRGDRTRASPPTRSTGSCTSTSAITAPTRRRWATSTFRSPAAPR